MEMSQPEPDRRELHDQWMHERTLLTQRLSVFLLANSILFVGFVGLIGEIDMPDVSELRLIVIVVGILSCLLLTWNSKGAKKNLDYLEKNPKLGMEKTTGCKKLGKGRFMGFWASLLFLGLWLFSLGGLYKWEWWLWLACAIAFGIWLFLVISSLKPVRK
jgi:hypothetical protein